MKTVDMLTLIKQDTALKKDSGTDGGEYSGPCPFCGGDDRFSVWPNRDRPGWWCRCCDRSGDAIQYVRERDGVGYFEACEELGIEPDSEYKNGGGGGLSNRSQTEQAKQDSEENGGSVDLKYEPAEPPCNEWQQRGREFVEFAQETIWNEEGNEGLEWLQQRGFTEQTIRDAGLGFNPEEFRDDPDRWGVEGKEKIWLPKGVVIPWRVEAELWRVNIRRLSKNGKEPDPKYIGPAGYSADRLYGADSVEMDKPAVIVEGEFDALIINQHAGGIVNGVATGCTKHARSVGSVGDLAPLPEVLVSFDVDENKAGEEASYWWLDKLPNAKRWRPWWGDPNDMYRDGADIKRWIESGLTNRNGNSVSRSVTPEPEGDRGPSGMSGSQQGNEDDDYDPDPERTREGEQDRGYDDDPAWCVMESDVLDGERFLLVRDDLYSSDQLQQRITEEARSQADAVYTMTEMNHITAAELTDEDKRKLHALKKAFGGDVLGEDPAGEAFPCVDISDWIESNGG